MELTPQSARSPTTSPYHYTSTSQPVYEYPSPAQSDSRYRSTESLHGLGLYSCQMSNSATTADGNTVPHLNSSAATDWPATCLQQRRTPPSSTQNIHSAEYDTFAPFQPAVSSSYSHDIYATQTAEVSVLPASPLPSGTTSQRSSFSSAAASEIFTQAESIQSHTPRIKMEDFTEYAPGNEPITYGSPQSAYSLLGPPTSSYPGSLEGAFYQEQSSLSWSKVEYASSPDFNPPYPNHGYESRSGNEDQSSTGTQEPRRGSSTVARTRQPRKLTTKEDANFQCQVKGCGKLFGRSYNYKAHMETHDASREYPFPCPIKDCNKKFVRKTDLQRHHQSVHMKQRNHRCDYCSRFFARKDTLRRHMEDGCSKRFDIETVDFRPQNYSNGEQSAMKTTPRSMDNQSRHPSYSSSHYSPPPVPSSQGPYDTPLTSALHGGYYESSPRPEYATGDGSHDGWSN